jgi:hypothetical protein
MTRTTGLVFAAVAVVYACGGSNPPTAPTNPPPIQPPQVGGTTNGRLVDVLRSDQGIGSANVAPQGLSATVSNESGYFVLQSAQPATFVVDVSSPSWVTRQTLLKVPGADTNVSLIPGSLNMTYFDEMCRGFGRVVRWGSAPALFVESAILQYGTRVASADLVPEAHLERTIGELRQVLPILSAGHFPDFASMERRTTAAGERSIAPAGAIALTWQRGLLDGFGHVAYGARQPGAPDGGLRTGEVALDFDWHALGLPRGSRTDFFNVVQHELGHTMGFSHTTTRPSFMYEVFLMTISAQDRDAFAIVMQRPSGNRTPDIDPSGTSLNVIVSDMVDIPRCRLPAFPR